MLILKRLLDFYINSSVHVALAMFCLSYVTVYSNGLCRHITYPSCIFFGTIIGYNFLKYFEIVLRGNFSLSKHIGVLLVTILALLGYFFFVIRMVDSIKIQLFLSAAMVLVYPFFRKYGIVKMFWVSFVIAYLTAFVFVNELPTFKGNVYLEFLKRFVFVSALMIPFEIYDSQYDDKALNTLPQRFGLAKAKIIGYFLLLVFVVLEFVSCHVNNNFKAQNFVIAVVTAAAIRFSTLERSQYYSSFWVESIPVLWFVLLYIFQ
ncbi:hypothetical protein [Flavobacterium mekongense]|uniref:hypothetical protein n=1 Tax=Flavobacterium mekongense TaxID=3379707 RepID=UPI00399C0E74